MTLVSTGIRQGILSCAVLGCYEWTFMLEPCSLEAREGLRYFQVNLSGRLHVSHSPALPGPQPCLVQCHHFPKAEVPLVLMAPPLQVLTQDELTPGISLQVDVRLRTSTPRTVHGCCASSSAHISLMYLLGTVMFRNQGRPWKLCSQDKAY